MVWSEKSSGEVVGDEGVMGTHDMETYKFFKNKNNYNGDNKVMIILYFHGSSSLFLAHVGGSNPAGNH